MQYSKIISLIDQEEFNYESLEEEIEDNIEAKSEKNRDMEYELAWFD